MDTVRDIGDEALHGDGAVHVHPAGEGTALHVLAQHTGIRGQASNGYTNVIVNRKDLFLIRSQFTSRSLFNMINIIRYI